MLFYFYSVEDSTDLYGEVMYLYMEIDKAGRKREWRWVPTMDHIGTNYTNSAVIVSNETDKSNVHIMVKDTTSELYEKVRWHIGMDCRLELIRHRTGQAILVKDIYGNVVASCQHVTNYGYSWERF